jgi:hypothetical protein
MGGTKNFCKIRVSAVCIVRNKKLIDIEVSKRSLFGFELYFFGSKLAKEERPCLLYLIQIFDR